MSEFCEACRKHELAPFLYHTTWDTHWNGVDTKDCSEAVFNEYLAYLHESIAVVCDNYGPLGGLWFDGNWIRPEADWKLDRLYGMIRQKQPQAIITNNTSINSPGVLQHPEIDVVTYEQSVPEPLDRSRHKKFVAQEMCQPLSSYWAGAERAVDYKSSQTIIENLATCRRVGGNYLLGIGLSPTGALGIPARATLKALRTWTDAYGAALYRPLPTTIGCAGRDFVLGDGDRLYYFAHDLPTEQQMTVSDGRTVTGPRSMTGVSRKIHSARWLDNGENLRVVQDLDTGIATIDTTKWPWGTALCVRIAVLEY